ncbi:MAG: efflux RND transporter periplasmic adaptor subunit [Bacteroidetes bacterium]|nr:efflux RND transporter periplasmic adaptor subunit [Bacteroidota bacterium]
MINIKKIFFVFALTPLVFSACNHTPVDEKAVAFSMSDTMYASCKFYDAAMQQVKSDIRLFGKITADNNKMSSVYPVVGGSVLQINVELGDYVHQGDVLAVIRSGEVAEFQKERLNALNDVAIAEKNLQVAKDLFAGKLNSERDVAAAKSELEKSKAELSRITDVYSIYSLKNGSIYNILAPLSGFRCGYYFLP